MIRQVLVVIGLGALTLGFVGFRTSAQTRSPEPETRGVARDGIDVYVERWREELRDGKAGIINDVMRLTDEEDDVFWEIYQQYEQEYFALGDRRLETAAALVEAMREGALDDPTAARLAEQALGHREELTALLRTYHTRISEELSPVRGAQFLQIESRVQTVIDLLVAAEMPLIRTAKDAPTTP